MPTDYYCHEISSDLFNQLPIGLEALRFQPASEEDPGLDASPPILQIPSPFGYPICGVLNDIYKAEFEGAVVAVKLHRYFPLSEESQNEFKKVPYFLSFLFVVNEETTETFKGDHHLEPSVASQYPSFPGHHRFKTSKTRSACLGHALAREW